MIYSVNQNRQFYVVNSIKTTAGDPTTEGQIKLGKTQDESQIFFKHMGKGGLTRTDIIDVDKISYVRYTTKAEMQRKLKKATITLATDVNSGNLVVGQDYVLRVQINNFCSPSDASVYIKSCAVRATAGMTATQFYAKMCDSLKANFSREPNEMLSFTSSATGIVITEVEQPWRLGVLNSDPVNFEIIPTEVTFNGADVKWGKVTYADTTAIGNGKKVADLEYFCMGERGDYFKQIGWPNNIDVKFMVDPTKEYDMLDIHYSFSDEGIQVHKSEKDLTLVSNTTKNITDLKTALEELGVKVLAKA